MQMSDKPAMQARMASYAPPSHKRLKSDAAPASLAAQLDPQQQQQQQQALEVENRCAHQMSVI